MGQPVSVLRGARAFARDMARDQMAPGYLWDVRDYVPMMIDALLTSRGAWIWGTSTTAGADYEAGILAPYIAGEQILAAANGQLYQVSNTSPYPITLRGTVPVARQNPVMLFDSVIWMDGSGAQKPYIVNSSGAPFQISGANAPNVKLGTIWGEYFVGGNQPGHEDTLYWGPPNDITQPWDANALTRTANQITGLAALRTIIIVFHPGSVERLRGSRPPAGTTQGDMILEPLFKQVGLTEPKTIAYWNENVVFADEHGVHITDGAVLRNLVQQGSIQSYWRNLYNNKVSICGAVFLDYYIVSVNRTDGITDTLVCDLNQRLWFRFTNLVVTCLFESSGTIGMERLFAGIVGTQRLARLSGCFFPARVGAVNVDGNGVNVQPYLETSFYKLSQEGRKRLRFVYLSYDARMGTLAQSAEPVGQMAAWQERFRPEEFVPVEQLDLQPQASATQALQCAYILNPQDTTWTTAGTYPLTSLYTRNRLPIGKMPYGIAFQIQQISPTSVTRVNDIAIEAHPVERSRV
jgi:hypothetical protein